MGNQLTPNFTEELIGFVIESYLTFISFPFNRFSIRPFSQLEEAKTGADALLEDKKSKIIPFYMQFKRPFAYPAQAERAKIIKDRNKLRLNSCPHALFFPLRKKAKTATEYQHNLLLNFSKNFSTGYVCPLFLCRKVYREAVYNAGCLNWLQKIQNRPQNIMQVNEKKKLLSKVPQLPGHIVFPPHHRVKTHNHYYSFSVNGDGLCFHSPEKIETNPLSFLDFIKKIHEEFSDETKIITAENANKKIKKLIRNMNIDFPLKEEEGENPFHGWLAWGEYLRKRYHIHQYAMIISDSE